jgi:thioredoxin 1
MNEFTKDNFDEEVFKSELPVMVDFWAPWCKPCLALDPFVEECFAEYDGKMKVGKVNIEDYPDLANFYGVMSIPTILFFKTGKMVGHIVGKVNKKVIEDKVKEIL